MSKKQRIATDDNSQLRSNPFAALAGALADVPEAAVSSSPPEVAVEASHAEPQVLRGKLIVRREKKGRGGKTATIIEGLMLEPDALLAFAQRLKKTLGCGGTIEGTTIVLTGAQTERVRDWLEREGATKVIVGN